MLAEYSLGVAQGDDLQYIFNDLWGKDLPMSSDDLKFSKNIFVPLLANFAKTRYFYNRIFTGHKRLILSTSQLVFLLQRSLNLYRQRGLHSTRNKDFFASAQN
jgi:hypothetical protein